MNTTTGILDQLAPTPVVKLDDFVGQQRIVADIKKRIHFAKQNNQPLPNIILSGRSEMGKNTLAEAIVSEFGTLKKGGSADKIERIGDLAAILTNLSSNDILIVDDISDFRKEIEKEFFHAIESGVLNMTIGKGSLARKIELSLPQFSVITTTSKVWQIGEKIRRWFVMYDFLPYSAEEMRRIFIKLAQRQGFHIESDSANILAQHCGGLPGNIEVMIKRISGFLRSISPNLEIKHNNISEVLTHLGFGESYPHSLTLVDKFSHMSGQEFEQWVADYFRKKGYEVRMTKITGDHGVDLQLYESNQLVGVVQCKNWNGAIGEPIVRDFYGSLISVKAPVGYIVAPTTFTQHAKVFAKDKPIVLVDLEELIKLAEIL